MFVFNFGVELLEQSVKLIKLVIFDFLGKFPSLNNTFSKPKTKIQFFFTVFSLLELYRCCGGKRKPT